MKDFINAKTVVFATPYHFSFGGQILFIIDDTSTNCP